MIDLIKKAEKQELLDFFTADLDEAIDMSGGTQFNGTVEHLADYLILNGVIVPPCKLGDIVYTTYNGSVSVYRVIELVMNGLLWAKLYNPDYSLEYETILACLDYSFNEFVFLTREEAEKALKERESNA